MRKVFGDMVSAERTCQTTGALQGTVGQQGYGEGGQRKGEGGEGGDGRGGRWERRERKS